MNLIFRASPLTHARMTTNVAPVALSTERQIELVTSKLNAKNAAKASAVTALEAACAAAERDEFGFGTGESHTGTINQLVQQITELEGQIEHLTRAIAGLEA